MYDNEVKPDYPGQEQEVQSREGWRGSAINDSNIYVNYMYCPVDGHFCEAPKCDNCNYESVEA